MSWTAFLLAPLITLVLATIEVDDDSEGQLDKRPPAVLEPLNGPFLAMGVINIVFAIVFGLISCIFYTKYRSKGSDDKKKMRR